VHQQPMATRCITFTSSPCLLQVCCQWPVHTHIPSCCRCTGSSSAMRISGGASATNSHDDSTTFTSYPCLLPEAGLIGNEDFRPCMLHVAEQLISKCRVQNECSAFCSHHIHVERTETNGEAKRLTGAFDPYRIIYIQTGPCTI